MQSTARFVAESVFGMLEATGWDRARTRWILAEIPGVSDRGSGVEAFQTLQDDLAGDDADDGLVGRRAGPEVVGMAIAGAVVPDLDRRSVPLRTVLAADRSGRWFRVAAGPRATPLRTGLEWFDGPGSGVRCYLGAPWRGPPPPDPHEVCTRWWVGSMLDTLSGGGGLAELEELAGRLLRLRTLELRGGWVPQVPSGWAWDQTRSEWASRAASLGDTGLAELVQWADPAELAARVRRATPVIDPDWLAALTAGAIAGGATAAETPAGEGDLRSVTQLLRSLGLVTG